MATANFCTMKDFPLYVTKDVDDFWALDEYQAVLDGFNNRLKFFGLSLIDGHYTGVQLYVYYGAERAFKSIEEMDNGDTWQYYDMCRSKAIRACNSEKTKIKRFMKRFAKKYGFRELRVVGRFSNGEVMYEYA